MFVRLPLKLSLCDNSNHNDIFFKTANNLTTTDSIKLNSGTQRQFAVGPTFKVDAFNYPHTCYCPRNERQKLINTKTTKAIRFYLSCPYLLYFNFFVFFFSFISISPIQMCLLFNYSQFDIYIYIHSPELS